MIGFFDNILGITEYLSHSTLSALTIIFARMVRSLWNGFMRLCGILKIITFLPFSFYLFIGIILVVIGFVTSVITYIPFLINKMGLALLVVAHRLSGDDGFNEYNFFQLVLFPLLIYGVVFIALILLIVPGIAISRSIGGV